MIRIEHDHIEQHNISTNANTLTLSKLINGAAPENTLRSRFVVRSSNA